MKSFQKMLMKIAKSIKDIGNFSVLLFLFIFIYTLLGLELFAFKIRVDSDGNIDWENGSSPR